MQITATNLVPPGGLALTSDDQKDFVILKPGDVKTVPNHLRPAASIRAAIADGLITVVMDVSDAGDFVSQDEIRALAFAVVTVPSAASITPNASQGGVFSTVITQATSIGLPTGMTNGQTILVKLAQDGIGGHAISFNNGYKFHSGIVPTNTMAANAVDLLSIIMIDGLFYASYSADMR